jgi:histidine triad (HIT) family protein
MSDCLFCKIVAGQVPSRRVFEDDAIIAFHDINPQAPVHVLLVPREHVASLDAARPGQEALLGRVLLAAQQLARELGVGGAYRVVTNCGAEAGQSVFHLHFHLLGGRPFHWPPG